MPWQISGLSEESEKATIETNQTSISNQDQTKKYFKTKILSQSNVILYHLDFLFQVNLDVG